MKKHLTLRNIATVVVLGAVVGFAVFWIVTIPATVSASALPPYTPNLDNGKTMFNIGGCSSCHAVPNKDPQKVDRTRLGGGLALPSPFGTFYAPNISPDPKDGIGNWSEADFVTAMWDGTAPDGSHLFPAFPHDSYRHMQLADVRDLFAYLKTLPPVTGEPPDHDLRFPFNIRRLVGAWKLLFLKGGPYLPDPSQSAQWNRGAYLVNGPGHCADSTRRAILSAASLTANALPAARRRTARTGCPISRRPGSAIGARTRSPGRKRTSPSSSTTA